MKRVIVFDVNETLLDLAALDDPFLRAFGHDGVRQEWFAQLLSSAFVSTITGPYRDFGTLAGASLDGLADRYRIDLGVGRRAEILDTMTRLPAHPDVVPAIGSLSAAGFRIATLTNSRLPVVTAQLESAGIAHRFERILSVDAIKSLKPAPETYTMAAAELDVPIDSIRLVAAHGWDVAGALAAGAAAAFVARPGVALDPAAPVPDIVAPNLMAVASRIIAVDGNP